MTKPNTLEVDLTHISRPTVTNYLKMYSQHWMANIKPKADGIKLKSYKQETLGYTQYDTKYITPSMTKFGRMVYFLNIKDTAAKTAFVFPSLTQDMDAFCESIRRAYEFF
jgi:hypothetical protein